MRSHVGKFYKNFARYLSAYKTTKSYLYTVLCRYEKIDNSMRSTSKMIICQLQGYTVSMTTYTTRWLMYTLYS